MMGQPLFNASHPTVQDGNQSNTATAAAISEASLESAIMQYKNLKMIEES